MSLVRVEIAEGVARVTLDDPDRRNALNLQMVEEIGAAFDRIDSDPEARAVVITGAGSAFCAGADVGVLLSGDFNQFRMVYEAFLRVRNCPLPTIAAVNGAATGAGLNLVLACDVCITAPSAKLIARFLDIGLLPGGGHTWMMSRLAGPAWTKAMLLFNEELDGEAAVTAGIALRCVAPEQLLAEADRMARRAARVPRELLVRAKQTVERMSSVHEHRQAVEVEAEAQAWSATLPHLQQRIEAMKQQIAARAAKKS